MNNIDLLRAAGVLPAQQTATTEIGREREADECVCGNAKRTDRDLCNQCGEDVQYDESGVAL